MKQVSLHNIRYYWRVYLFVLPSLLMLLLFAYFPTASAIYHSFFNWDGAEIKVFVGWDNFRRALTDEVLGRAFVVVAMLVVANLFKMIPSIMTAVVIHRLRSDGWAHAYRVLFVVPMIVPAMVWLLIWKYFFDPSYGVWNKALAASGGMAVLRLFDGFLGWGVFVEGVEPAWLGRQELIVPALIIWGFPWVGVVGVLIYLAGLSQIDEQVYEAGEIDGVGWFRKFLNIELPLIMTQVRLNLVLMIISTLQAYGLVLVLLGDAGGPGGAGMVPGLYMFRKAFVDQEAGYACAIGLLVFVAILALTMVNNRFVRVKK